MSAAAFLVFQGVKDFRAQESAGVSAFQEKRTSERKGVSLWGAEAVSSTPTGKTGQEAQREDKGAQNILAVPQGRGGEGRRAEGCRERDVGRGVQGEGRGAEGRGAEGYRLEGCGERGAGLRGAGRGVQA